jgi:hypothetical protein
MINPPDKSESQNQANENPVDSKFTRDALGLSNCKNSHLRENDEKQFYDAVKAAFDDYYSLDKFNPDAWR